MAIMDLTNQKYGDWLVLYHDEEYEQTFVKEKGYKKTFWMCKCENCGTEKPVRANDLRNGKSTNCGCKRYQNIYNKTKFSINQKIGRLTIIEEDLEKEKTSKLQKSFWKCRCECGSITSVTGSDLKNGHTISCGCVKSKGEEKISKLLLALKINFEKEKTFPTCISEYHNVPYRFDFFLPDFNLLIEYDGKQHFTQTEGWNNEINFKQTQKRDAYKNKWCQDNNIFLLRIPYTEYNKLNKEYLKEKIYEISSIRP